MKPILLLLSFTYLLSVHAQNNSTPPCSLPEASQFDFWVGDWKLTWNDTSHGTNHIEKIFGNCTVQENFVDAVNNYLGKSWSVYNANYKIWQQTWVDNQGGFTDVSGNMHGDSMILLTQERTVPQKISPTGKMINRMVYYNITHQSFDWSWESSTDGGSVWKSNWRIHYERNG